MPDFRPFLYGGLASMTAELITFPIDTSKTRLQLQGQVIDASQKTIRYKGMFHTFFKVTKEEGIRALYNGVSPALLRQATYGTLKIGFYHLMKRATVKDVKDESLFLNVIFGIIAGVCSSAICNPTDLLKIRMQAQYRIGAPKQNLIKSFIIVYKEEGLRGLYRGVGPTSQRAGLIAGVELPVYDFSKKLLVQEDKLNMKDGPYAHFIASAVAGLAGALASNPVDVAKTRMMNQRNLKVKKEGSPILYKSALDCIVTTLRTEGFFALYRGFIPNFVRLCPWNIAQCVRRCIRLASYLFQNALSRASRGESHQSLKSPSTSY